VKPPKNAWMLGYNAAMRAPIAELTEAGERRALEKAHERWTMGEVADSAFRAGWRSVLRCERLLELADATRDHGEMCPCDACREVRAL